jgi:hypothetical protein
MLGVLVLERLERVENKVDALGEKIDTLADSVAGAIELNAKVTGITAFAKHHGSKAIVFIAGIVSALASGNPMVSEKAKIIFQIFSR